MARQQQYTLGRVFVGDRPLEDLTPEEQAAFRRRTVDRMGEVFNAYFSRNPEVYAHVCEQYEARDAGQGIDSPGAACAHPVGVQEATA